MKFVTWLLVIALATAVFGTHRSVRASRSEAERFFAMRVALVSWLAGFAFLLALMFLPNKQRVLLLIPIFFSAVTLAKVWRNGRARLRRETDERERLDRMKRVN